MALKAFRSGLKNGKEGCEIWGLWGICELDIATCPDSRE